MNKFFLFLIIGILINYHADADKKGSDSGCRYPCCWFYLDNPNDKHYSCKYEKKTCTVQCWCECLVQKEWGYDKVLLCIGEHQLDLGNRCHQLFDWNSGIGGDPRCGEENWISDEECFRLAGFECAVYYNSEKCKEMIEGVIFGDCEIKILPAKY